MNEQKMISQPIQAYLTQIFCRCSAVKMRMYIQKNWNYSFGIFSLKSFKVLSFICNLLCSPVFVPQILGGAASPVAGPVTVKVSVLKISVNWINKFLEWNYIWKWSRILEWSYLLTNIVFEQNMVCHLLG